MRSSTNSAAPFEPRKVMLPSFEQMVKGYAPLIVDDDEDDEEQDNLIEDELPEEEDEIEKTRHICANMRQEAVKEAEKMLAEANQESLSIRRKAHKSGYDDGRAEVMAKVNTALNELYSSADALGEYREALYNKLSERFLDTALNIAKSILKYELDKNDAAYAAIVRNALSQMNEDDALTLRLPSKGYAAIMESEFCNELKDELMSRGVTVTPDNSLPDGDCIVTSDNGGVHAGVETQLTRLKEGLAAVRGDGAK